MRKPHVIVTEADFVGVMALQPHPALQDELERATVVAADVVPPGVVTMNSRVRYFDEHSGVCREIELVTRSTPTSRTPRSRCWHRSGRRCSASRSGSPSTGRFRRARRAGCACSRCSTHPRCGPGTTPMPRRRADPYVPALKPGDRK